MAALVMAEKEKVKSKAAVESAEMARRAAEVEMRRRKAAEMAATTDQEERNKVLIALMKSDNRYRRYTIEEIEVATDFFSEKRKIGEGGYGPVFKGILDHTLVAIKILRPDAAQGRSQFQQEVSNYPLIFTFLSQSLYLSLSLLTLLFLSGSATELHEASKYGASSRSMPGIRMPGLRVHG